MSFKKTLKIPFDFFYLKVHYDRQRKLEQKKLELILVNTKSFLISLTRQITSNKLESKDL